MNNSSLTLYLCYPKDFCKESQNFLLNYVDYTDRFVKADVRIIGMSGDNDDTHNRWLSTLVIDGGVNPLNFELRSVPTDTTVNDYIESLFDNDTGKIVYHRSSSHSDSDPAKLLDIVNRYRIGMDL
jgi:hypothetical protein